MIISEKVFSLKYVTFGDFVIDLGEFLEILAHIKSSQMYLSDSNPLKKILLDREVIALEWRQCSRKYRIVPGANYLQFCKELDEAVDSFNQERVY